MILMSDRLLQVDVENVPETIEELFSLFHGFDDLGWREVFKVKDKFGHVDEGALKQLYDNYCTLRQGLPQLFSHPDIPRSMFGEKLVNYHVTP